MLVEKNRVVVLHYTVTDEQGNLLDTSSGRIPLSYLHGKGNIIPGLEQALVGRTAGEKLEVTIPPEQGYGLRNERMVQIIARSLFEEGLELTPGMRVQASGPQGARLVTIVRVERDFVTIDANHPLAGRTLLFSVEIAEVRKATHEEVSHGHVHGAGGHHH